jgi:hypothetical protein
MGACSVGFCAGLQNWSFLRQPVADSYAKLLIKLFSGSYIFMDAASVRGKFSSVNSAVGQE